MADNDQSKVRYDDFISAVQPDPAKPEAAIMLAGFVGHGPDGQVRIYPDPTLGKWYDVAEGDVLHAMPIADSKLGGSYVWVRDSAQIKPGSAAVLAAPAPQAAAAANVPPQTAQDCTLALCNQNQNQNWGQPTPQTHCFICPPLTQACQIQTQLHCLTQPVVCDTPPQSLHCATHPVVCDIPPHRTLATICTQVGCITQPVVCGILPPSINCTQQGCGAGGQQQGGQQAQLHAMALQPTPSAVHQCGGGGVHPTPSAVHQCGGGGVHPTPSAVHQCGGVHPTLATLCTQPHLCAPQAPGTAMFSWPAQCPSQFCSAVGTCGQAPQAAGPQMQAQPMAGPPGTAMFYCTMNCGAQMQPQAMAAVPAPAMPMASQLLCTPFDGCAAPQAAAALQPAPSAVNQCGQPLTQGICPTPSAINQCGQPLTQGICPTLSAIHLCGQPLTQAICATPTATQPGFCNHTANIACLQTAIAVCGQTGVAGCVPSIACAPTPNGVFTPFGR